MEPPTADFPPGTLPMIQDTRAYLLHPARAIVSGSVVQWEWSPSGSRIGAITSTGRGASRKNRAWASDVEGTTRDLGPVAEGERILTVAADGTVVTATIQDPGGAVFVLEPGRRTRVTGLAADDQPFAAFRRPTDGRLFLGGAGFLISTGRGETRRYDLGKGTVLGFEPDGRFLLYRDRKYVTVDLATGKERALSDRKGRVENSSPFIEHFTGKGGVDLYWEKPGVATERAAEVSREAANPALDPEGRGIGFLVAGALLIRPIEKTDFATADALVLQREREEKMSTAKQVAISFLIAASDDDDRLPGDDWSEKLVPYIKDRSLIAQFSRTFSGRDLTKVERPAETQLGFVSGRGGRAIVYLDGHVKWEPIKR